MATKSQRGFCVGLPFHQHSVTDWLCTSSIKVLSAQEGNLHHLGTRAILYPSIRAYATSSPPLLSGMVCINYHKRTVMSTQWTCRLNFEHPTYSSYVHERIARLSMACVEFSLVLFRLPRTTRARHRNDRDCRAAFILCAVRCLNIVSRLVSRMSYL